MRKKRRPFMVNAEIIAAYMRKKGVQSGYIFGSSLRIVDPKHDIDVAVALEPTKQNLRKFADATRHGIDVFLLGRGDTLFSVGLGDVLYEDTGLPVDLGSVGAKKVIFKRRRK